MLTDFTRQYGSLRTEAAIYEPSFRNTSLSIWAILNVEILTMVKINIAVIMDTMSCNTVQTIVSGGPSAYIIRVEGTSEA